MVEKRSDHHEESPTVEQKLRISHFYIESECEMNPAM
jgi:hypothetical protein